MARPCLACMRPVPEGKDYHARCASELFGTRTVPRLDVDPANLHLLGLEMAGRVSLSGVQKKIALGIEKSTLRMVGPEGRYILKPPTDVYPDLPQNEQLCTRIARELGVTVPSTGLVRMSDDSLAFLARRFDRTEDGRKLAVEDFCQLTEKLPRDKYRGSAELCAKVLEGHSDEPVLDGLRLFRLWFVSWWLGNADLHLKNIALLRGEDGRYRLSPAYDLVSTRLVIDEETMAMPLGGKGRKYTEEEWFDFAKRCSIPPRALANETRKMLGAAEKAVLLIKDAPLRSEFRRELLGMFMEGNRHAMLVYARALLEDRVTVPTVHPSVPTAKFAVATAHRLRSALDRFHLDRRQGRPLDEYLAELDWLGRGTGSIFRQDGPWTEDRARARRALWTLLRMDALSRLIDDLPGIAGSEERARHILDSRLQPTGHAPDQAGDRLFELEVAGALGRWPYFEIGFDGNDVVLRDSEGTVLGLECKRPRKGSTIVRNVAKGVDQLAKSERAGFVVVSLDGIAQVPWYESARREEVLRDAGGDLRKRIDPWRDEILETLPPRTPDEQGLNGAVFAVLVTMTIGLSHRQAAGAHLRHHLLVERVYRTEMEPWRKPVVDVLAGALQSGYDRVLSGR